MAKRLSRKVTPPASAPAAAPPAEAHPKHNMEDRGEFIRNSKRQLDTLGADIKALREQVKNKNKEVGNIFRLLKNDLGMDRMDAELALRMCDVDAENRSQFVDTVREIFKACLPGEQASFLDALDQQGAGGSDRPAPGTIAEDGYEAGLAGKDASTNPYDNGSDAHATWLANWTKGQSAAVNHTFGANGSKAPAEATTH